MSNPIHATSNAKALAEPHSAKMAKAVTKSYPLGRPDSQTAQHIEVGLVLNTILGPSAASDYLARQSVSPKVVQRVLSESGRRRRSDKDGKLS